MDFDPGVFDEEQVNQMYDWDYNPRQKYETETQRLDRLWKEQDRNPLTVRIDYLCNDRNNPRASWSVASPQGIYNGNAPLAKGGGISRTIEEATDNAGLALLQLLRGHPDAAKIVAQWQREQRTSND